MAVARALGLVVAACSRTAATAARRTPLPLRAEETTAAGDQAPADEETTTSGRGR